MTDVLVNQEDLSTFCCRIGQFLDLENMSEVNRSLIEKKH